MFEDGSFRDFTAGIATATNMSGSIPILRLIGKAILLFSCGFFIISFLGTENIVFGALGRSNSTGDDNDRVLSTYSIDGGVE